MVTEADAVEGDVTAHGADVARFFGVGDGDGGVEHDLDAVEGGEAALELVVERADFFHRFVAEVQGGDDREEDAQRHAFAVGVEERERDAEGGNDFDDRAEGLRVFHDLELRGNERAAGVGEARGGVFFQTEGADFARGSEVLGNLGGDVAELALDLGGAFHDLAAHVADGEHAQRDECDAHEDEQHALFSEGEPREVADGGEQGQGLFHAVVGEDDERVLQLPGVGEAARDEIAGGTGLDEGKGERLELPEIVEADGLQYAGAGGGDVVGIEVAGDAAQEKHHREPGGDGDEFPCGEGAGGRIKDHGEDDLRHQRQAQTIGRRKKKSVENRRDERAALCLEVLEVGEKATHGRGSKGGKRESPPPLFLRIGIDETRGEKGRHKAEAESPVLHDVADFDSPVHLQW